ncbi:MAG: ribosome silencing factor [Lachnospiraceae bacterium]|nr:ribosome silencing factor [Lachnospiraceae bacterium]
MSKDKEKSAQMARIAIDALGDKKGEDIRVLDISEVSVLADYFVIASGKNRNQIQAMKENVEEQMEKAGYFVKNVEGYDAAHWILMDYGDVILHIFDEENRLFYDLERIWRDGKPLDAASLSDSGVEA